MNPLNLNNNRKFVPTGVFNCGGFALRNLEWYIPESYCRDWNILADEVRLYLEDCANDIMDSNSNLVRIKDIRHVPKRFGVVGFRFAVVDTDPDDLYFVDENNEETGEEVPEDTFYHFLDFHFVRRENGVWYEKPGRWYIQKMYRNNHTIHMPWEYDGYNKYNSDIIWFLDTTTYSQKVEEDIEQYCQDRGNGVDVLTF